MRLSASSFNDCSPAALVHQRTKRPGPLAKDMTHLPSSHLAPFRDFVGGTRSLSSEMRARLVGFGQADGRHDGREQDETADTLDGGRRAPV